MKKTHFIIITAIASVAAFSCPYAAGEKHDIPVQKVIPNTRSIANIPKASIDTQTCILDISFDRSGMYVLSIEDSFGATVYSSTLPADGMEYSYDLLDFKTKGMSKKISNIYSTGDDYRTKSNENDVQSPFVYVVNFADDMGFALVSGDTRMPPILAMIDNLPDF